MGDKKYHYCVLYTRVLKQWEVYRVMKRALPEGKGVVFYPCAELWWNDRVNTVIRPLFPGYVFVRSELERSELHQLIRDHRRDIDSFVRELRTAEARAAGDDIFAAKEESILLDLRDDEAEFLDFMLNFRYEDALEEDTSSHRKFSDSGVLRMSRGYYENGKYHVVEGPLKGYEDHIIDVDKRKRKAYLDIKIGEHIAKAGLELMGKRHYFPDDKYGSDVLEDGTEIDPVELAQRMMSHSGSNRSKERR